MKKWFKALALAAGAAAVSTGVQTIPDNLTPVYQVLIGSGLTAAASIIGLLMQNPFKQPEKPDGHSATEDN